MYYTAYRFKKARNMKDNEIVKFYISRVTELITRTNNLTDITIPHMTDEQIQEHKNEIEYIVYLIHTLLDKIKDMLTITVIK